MFPFAQQLWPACSENGVACEISRLRNLMKEDQMDLAFFGCSGQNTPDAVVKNAQDPLDPHKFARFCALYLRAPPPTFLL